MTTPGHGSGDPSQLDPEAVVLALNRLNQLLLWRLAPGQWHPVEPIIDTMAGAVAAGDSDALRAGTADLEMVSPLRVTRIGSGPEVPAPERIRDRANHLVHLLGGVASTQGEPAEPPPDRRGGGDDRPSG
jgi:hypothetical protein